ncbi:MAG TPA: hypothetical protein VGZ32_27460 [Actinocrinis sp.]|jgi:hypothetical protein|uniref:hypothetical protein n=1 Tax=Actinocrinis sp. TaxID=1920516 RepID=UPI002DDD88F5|nr:hypothetical protein [Actinocrinis sp.]HEV3174117.1 hypothetical protein [Actinocrinis sp.]
MPKRLRALTVLAVCAGLGAGPAAAAGATPAAVPAPAARTAPMPPSSSTVSGLVVSVGYAEDKETNTPDPAAFPTPWVGSPNITFLGNSVPGQSACGSLTTCYDTGAIRFDNPGWFPVTVSSVDIDIHSSISGGKYFTNLWGAFTVPAGKSVILAANPPANDPSYDNFDTSGYPPNICTPVTVAPRVLVTIGGRMTTLLDTTHVLDTDGIDRGFCHQNESIQWRPIGTGVTGSHDASLSLDNATPNVMAGIPYTATAILLDSGGYGLANVQVQLKAIGGPDSGTTWNAVTDANGNASFMYLPAGTGQDDLLATVTTVGSFTSPPPLPCPAPWTCQDIGGPALTGSQYFDPSSNTWTITAGGTDITGTSDQFRFVSQPLTGDGSVTAYIASQSDSSSNAKAGVMLRVSNDPGAANYAVLVSPGAGIKVQKRSAQGATTAKLANPTGTAPVWLRVTRAGDTYTAYTSTDGVTWTLIPGSSYTVAFGSTLLAGVAVTSHNASALGTVTASSVSVG